ncbi:MAG: hypothetical protein MK132_15380 [Lentisphaerales bacterium]|nr:hypothetical protein [Lentisphaerales bacterium]
MKSVIPLLLLIISACTSQKETVNHLTSEWTYQGLNRKSATHGKYTFRFTSTEKTMDISMLLWHKRLMSRTQDIYSSLNSGKPQKIEAKSQTEQLLIKIIDENLLRSKSVYRGEELNWLKHKIKNRRDGAVNLELNSFGAAKALKPSLEDSLSGINSFIFEDFSESDYQYRVDIKCSPTLKLALFVSKTDKDNFTLSIYDDEDFKTYTHSISYASYDEATITHTLFNLEYPTKNEFDSFENEPHPKENITKILNLIREHSNQK